MWAASPMRTVLPCDQWALTTVLKVSQEELLERSGRPPSAASKIVAQCRIDSAGSQVSNPAARQTSSRISTMTVEAFGEKG